MKYDVFISYRREGGREYARLIQQSLQRYDYRVFFDYDSLQDGVFNNQIFEAIKSTPVFLLVLSPKSMQRCVNAGDWVAEEIKYAIKHQKKIVPVNIDDKFDGFPEQLYAKGCIGAAIRDIQFTKLDMGELYDNSIERLIEKRISPTVKPRKSTTPIVDSGALIHIRADMDCSVMKFSEEVGLYEAGKFYVLRLAKGRCVLDFISLDHPADHVEIIYEVKDNDIEDFFDVELTKVRDQRLKETARKVEEDRKRVADKKAIAEQERKKREAERKAIAEQERKKREAEQRRVREQEIARQEARRKKEEKENEARKEAEKLREREIQREKNRQEIEILRSQRLAREQAEREEIERKWAKKSYPQIENKRTTFKQSEARRVVKTLTYTSGDTYVGEVNSCGQRHGKGVYTWSDGDKYEGDFVEGNSHGKGVFTWANGDKYEGDYVEDKRHGKGVYTWANGRREVQEYKNGSRQTAAQSTQNNAGYNSSLNHSTRKLILFKAEGYYGKYGYRDQYGNVVVSPKYSRGDTFVENRAKVELGRFGFIDTDGKEIIPLIYENAMRFSEGLAAVMKNGLWGYIDYYGKVVIPFKYNDAYSFSNGLAQVRHNGYTYTINKSGNRA